MSPPNCWPRCLPNADTGVVSTMMFQVNTLRIREKPGAPGRYSETRKPTNPHRPLFLCAAALTAGLICAALPVAAQEKQVKPMAGPRATALRVTFLYVSPDTSAQKVDRVQIGREMVIAEKSGPWIRVYANTDIQEVRTRDTPEYGRDDTPPPIS